MEKTIVIEGQTEEREELRAIAAELRIILRRGTTIRRAHATKKCFAQSAAITNMYATHTEDMNSVLAPLQH
jgi:hypothetical protein